MHGVRLVLDGYPCSVDPIQVERAEIGGLVEAGPKRARSVAGPLTLTCL